MNTTPPIALLAGEGNMPIQMMQAIEKQGFKVFLLALRGCTSEQLAAAADDVIWLDVVQLGKAIRACKRRGVKEIVFAGRVRHNRLFSLSLLKMDWTAFRVLWKLRDYRADTLLAGIAQAFIDQGIEVGSSVKFLQKFLCKKGELTTRSPSAKEQEDIDFGIKLAKEMGRLDIGQTVVVKNRTVVAVEAMEGTDYCLERAGQVAGKGCIAVKVAKPNQDLRFDVPVIGLNTIEKLAKIGAAGIAIEAGATLVLDPEVVQKANSCGLFVVGI